MKPTTSSLRRVSSRCWAVAVAAALCASAAGAQGPTVAGDLGFVPPAAGTYDLERIMQVPDGAVMDTSSKRRRLADYTRGKITVLSLMFAACGDENGCPLAFYTLDLVRRNLEKSNAARQHVRLVSLSFDPEHDTPEVMRAYGGDQAKWGRLVPWHFLTTVSARDLTPMLEGLGQDVSTTAVGQADGELMHVLKLFLIDKSGWVREIYTNAYLSPQVVENDIKTLLIEQGVNAN